MHGIVGFSLPNMSLSTYLGLKKERKIVYYLYFVGFMVSFIQSRLISGDAVVLAHHQLCLLRCTGSFRCQYDLASLCSPRQGAWGFAGCRGSNR